MSDGHAKGASAAWRAFRQKNLSTNTETNRHCHRFPSSLFCVVTNLTVGTTFRGHNRQGRHFLPDSNSGGGECELQARGQHVVFGGRRYHVEARGRGDADSAIWTCSRPPVDPSIPSGPNANANTRAHGHGGRRMVAARAYAWVWVWVLVAGHVREGGGARTSWRAA